jgi:hypothetical protein
VTRASLLAASVLLVAAAGCGGGGSKSAVATTTVTKTLTTTNPTGTAAAHGRFRYPASIREHYMRSCTQNNVKETYCACTLDRLSDTVTTEDFTRIGLSGGQISTRIRTLITQAAAACKDKL